MKKRNKIILSISLVAILMLSFAITSFATYSDSITGINLDTLYLYRYNDSYNPASGYNYYYSIYTEYEKDDTAWVKDVTNLNYNDFLNIKFDAVLNQSILEGIEYRNAEEVLYLFLNYLNAVTVNNASPFYQFGRTSIVDKYPEHLSYITWLFLSGFYNQKTYDNDPDSPTYGTTTFENFVNAINSGKQHYEIRYDLFWYKFICNLGSAISYCKNQAESDTEYDSPVFSFCMSSSLKDFLCTSLYNIIYYEFGLTNYTLNQVKAIFDTVYNTFNGNVPSGFNADDYYFEVYINKYSSLIVNTQTGNYTLPHYAFGLTKVNTNDKNDYYHIFSRTWAYLRSHNIFDWLPAELQVGLYGVLFMNFGLAAYLFARKLII